MIVYLCWAMATINAIAGFVHWNDDYKSAVRFNIATLFLICSMVARKVAL